MKIAFNILQAIALAGILFSACDRKGKSGSVIAKETVVRPLSQHMAAMMQPMDSMMDRIKVIKLTGDFDYDFAGFLIEHNRAASGMASLELENGTDEKVKGMASFIIRRNESAEIKLRQFLKSARSSALKNNRDTIHHAFQDAIANTVVRMKGLMMTGDIDKDFIMMMIPHHETSNEIYKSQLEQGKNVLLKQLSQNTTAIQKKELDSLNVWAFEMN